MSKKIISESYKSSKSFDIFCQWLNDESNSIGYDFFTNENFRNIIKERFFDSKLNIKECYMEIDEKKNGFYEKYYNNLATFNELFLNDPEIKSFIKEIQNFDNNNHNENFESPNDLVHNEHTDSWDEPTWEQQLSRIEENVNHEQMHLSRRNDLSDIIVHCKDKLFDEYIDLFVCRKPRSSIFGRYEYELVQNFPMLVGQYKNGIKYGEWFYHSFNSDLTVCFSFRNPEHDVAYKDDTNGKIHLISFLRANDTPNILNKKINDWDLGVELSHFDDDDLSIEKFMKFDWENRFNREKVFNFLSNFKHKDVSYTGPREDDLPF